MGKSTPALVRATSKSSPEDLKKRAKELKKTKSVAKEKAKEKNDQKRQKEIHEKKEKK